MGARENKVERYLTEKVKMLGGLARKWTNPTYSVPDQILIIPYAVKDVMYSLSKMDPDALVAQVLFVEVKTEDGKLSELQARELTRITNAGSPTFVVYGEKGVDQLVEMIAPKKPAWEVEH